MAETTITLDSDDYKTTLWGILNADGNFWTPLVFDSDGACREYLEIFAKRYQGRYDSILETHKAVPVRVQLTAKDEVE